MSRGALERGIDILFLVASAGRPLDAYDIAAQSRLPRSSVYRLLQLLRRRGLIEAASDGTGCRLGLILLKWASALRGGLDLAQLAAPVLRRLARNTGETATLTLPHGTRAVVAYVTDSAAPLRVTSAVGRSLPLHAGASSKAILAFLARGTMATGVEHGTAGRLHGKDDYQPPGAMAAARANPQPGVRDQRRGSAPGGSRRGCPVLR